MPRDATILGKTAKGLLEIEQRAHGLAQGLRRILILVDGRRSCAELRRLLGDAPDSTGALEHLLEQGFVETRQSAAPGGEGARAELAALVHTTLGGHALRVLPALERCADEPGALEAALTSAAKLVKLTVDERLGDRLLAEGRLLLQRHR